jgi:hypothetical protein
MCHCIVSGPLQGLKGTKCAPTTTVRDDHGTRRITTERRHNSFGPARRPDESPPMPDHAYFVRTKKFWPSCGVESAIVQVSRGSACIHTGVWGVGLLAKSIEISCGRRAKLTHRLVWQRGRSLCRQADAIVCSNAFNYVNSLLQGQV